MRKYALKTTAEIKYGHCRRTCRKIMSGKNFTVKWLVVVAIESFSTSTN